MTLKSLLTALLTVAIVACTQAPEDSAAVGVNKIAQEFVDGYYAQYPEEIYEIGYPESSPDHFGDHSLENLAAWDAEVDSWIAALDMIDVAQLAGMPEQITYVFAQERLQAIVDRRTCRGELWNISPTWTGWQYMLSSTLAVQPVDTATDREAALLRLADIPRFVRTEISNLRRGEDEGYTAATSNVDVVVEKVTSLIDTPTEDSPFFSPALRSNDAEFIAAFREEYEMRVIPELVDYRNFLNDEYEGRDAIGVSDQVVGSCRTWARRKNGVSHAAKTNLGGITVGHRANVWPFDRYVRGIGLQTQYIVIVRAGTWAALSVALRKAH